MHWHRNSTVPTMYLIFYRKSRNRLRTSVPYLSLLASNEKLRQEVAKRDKGIDELKVRMQQMQEQHGKQIRNLQGIHNQELEAIQCSGKIYSEEHRRKFDIRSDIFKVEKHPMDSSKLVLTINRQSIGEWFKEQWEKLRRGLRQSEEEPRKSRGFKI